MRVYPHYERANLDQHARASRLPPGAIIPLPSNEPSVPRQQGVGSDDTGDFGQEFPAERFSLYGEPTSLVVGEAKPPPAETSLEDPVLLQ